MSLREKFDWIDPLGVIFFSMITLIVLGSIALMYVAHQADLRAEEYRHACIDIGGIPVITHNYVKGSKDGYLCINPSAIIEVN